VSPASRRFFSLSSSARESSLALTLPLIARIASGFNASVLDYGIDSIRGAFRRSHSIVASGHFGVSS
jgi:hypothetical protein